MRYSQAVGLVLALAGSGCSIDRMVSKQLVPTLERTRDSFNRETVPRFAREAGPALLATVDGVVCNAPDYGPLRLVQAELNATFAFAFLETVDPIWATSHYRKAQRAALVALAEEDEELADELPGLSGAALTQRLEALDEDALPALFWWAFARGAEVNLNRGDPGQVAQLERVDAVMEWVLRQDERYYHGGPHLYLGMRYVALPASLGGDPGKALAHFEAVDRITGGRHLLAKVLRAQFYGPTLAATPAGADLQAVLAAQKRAWEAWFEALDAVVKSPEDLWPEQALPNAVARERARALLADPESNNVIIPPGVVNPYAASSSDEGWGDDDAGAWEDAGGGQ